MQYQELEASVYDKVYAGLTDDIPFWQALALEYCGSQGEALELACGTLRVMLPVAEAGVRVTGIDESPYMLERARKKLELTARDVRERITLQQGDMRAFELARQFDFIYVPFNTFGLLLTIQDQLAALQAVKQHLKPGGVFAFNVFFPDMDKLHGPRLSHWMSEVDNAFPDGSRIQRDNTRNVDTRKQIISVTWRTKVYQDQILAQEFLSEIRLSYFFPREIENLFARAGYEILHYWGDLERHAFWTLPDPKRQLVVAKPIAQA
jgi:SAM-dependent methyltransferase